jgi:hypothetical protein
MSAGQRNNGSLKGHRPFGRGGRPGGHGGHGSHGRMPVERAKDFKGTLKRLLKLLKPYRVKLFAVLILAALSTVFSIVSPKIMGLVTTELFEGVIVSGAGVDFSYIAHILIILGGLYLISAFFNYLQQFIMVGVAQKLSQEQLQLELFSPAGCHHGDGSGDGNRIRINELPILKGRPLTVVLGHAICTTGRQLHLGRKRTTYLSFSIALTRLSRICNSSFCSKARSSAVKLPKHSSSILFKPFFISREAFLPFSVRNTLETRRSSLSRHRLSSSDFSNLFNITVIVAALI